MAFRQCVVKCCEITGDRCTRSDAVKLWGKGRLGVRSDSLIPSANVPQSVEE